MVVWRGGWPPALSVTALVVVGGALAWGLGTVAAARVVRGPARPLALGGWQMALGGVVLLALGAPGRGRPSPAGAREAGLVLGLAVLGSAVPLACFYLALVRAPAARVSAWFFLVPVVGVLSAWPLLGERPGPRLLVGMVLVAVGLWLVLGGGGRAGGRLVDSPPPP